MKGISRAGVITVALLIIGCTSTQIPKASVELSEIVGEQTTQIQTSHEAFVKLYYNELREDVDVFMREKWVPEFLARAVENERFKATHTEAYMVSSLNQDSVEAQISHLPAALRTSVFQAVKAQKAELGNVLIGFGEAAVVQIEKQRTVMIGRIDEQEQAVLSHLRETYVDLYRAQSTIEANLRTTAEITEQKEIVLRKLGLLENQNVLLNKAMHASSLASRALNAADSGTSGMKDFLRALGGAVLEVPVSKKDSTVAGVAVTATF
ncbi:MAG: hypothetical protein AAF564_08565 [Bacteroidota bacterium]